VRKNRGCEARAMADMRQIWQPDGVWKDFIEAQARAKH